MITCNNIKELKTIISQFDKDILFRGSGIYKKRIYPRMYKNKKLIFATNKLILALSYMRCKNFENKYFVAQNYNKNENKMYLIEQEKDNIKKMFSCTGYIYILDKNKFKKTTFDQLKDVEFISNEIQKPLLIIKIENVYEFIKDIKNIVFKYINTL